MYLTLLPAIVAGCSTGVFQPEVTASPHLFSSTLHIIQADVVPGGNTLDILVFNDDKLRKLDAYQRMEAWDGSTAYPASTGGDKIFFLCCNPQMDRYGWAEINSYQSLDKLCCNLEDEDREKLVMTGECRNEAGRGTANAEVTPLASEILLKSLKCDFSGTPYAGKKIKDVRAYLTYVNASCGMLGNSSGGTIRIINSGMLDAMEVKNFRDSSTIVQEITRELGNKSIGAEKSFLCYPYTGDRSRSTRLVIEGLIDGEKYFWPIAVCPEEGILRNRRYVFKIVIKRKGVSDPDYLIDPVDADILLEIKQWTEKEEYQVRF